MPDTPGTGNHRGGAVHGKDSSICVRSIKCGNVTVLHHIVSYSTGMCGDVNLFLGMDEDDLPVAEVSVCASGVHLCECVCTLLHHKPIKRNVPHTLPICPLCIRLW